MYKKIVSIFKDNVDSIVKTGDAILVYLKSGKCWVCDKVIKENDGQFQLTLKGKCDK